MQADAPSPTAIASIVGVTPRVARWLLLNVADTLQTTVLPGLDDSRRKRAQQCIELLTRLVWQADKPVVPDPAALDLISSKVDSLASLSNEGSLLESAEAEISELLEALGKTAALRDKSAVDIAGLQDFLRAHPRGGASLQVTEAVSLPGGRSKQTILVNQIGARDLPASFIVRRDWDSALTGTSVVSEYEVLRYLHTAGIRVPRPLLVEASSAALGAPFMAVAKVQGQVVGDLFTPSPIPTVALQLAEQLGRLHGIPSEHFELLPGIPQRDFTPEELRVTLAQMRQAIDTLDVPSSTVGAALRWLEQHVDRVQGPRSLVHGELGFHNFLVHGDELTAILDWELVHFGSPARDLGYIRSAIERVIPWPQFMKAYRDAGGPQVSAFLIDYYRLFGGLWLYHFLLRARDYKSARSIVDIESAYVYAHYIAQLRLRLSRELRSVLASEAERGMSAAQE